LDGLSRLLAIWIAAIVSSNGRGVSPGAMKRSRCFSVTFLERLLHLGRFQVEIP
jgi:hypothetical protein